MPTDAPVTGASVSALISIWAQLPLSSSQETYSIEICARTRQTFLPAAGRRDTKTSVPRCPCSRKATTAPMKVSHTNSHRDSSSDTVMPEFTV